MVRFAADGRSTYVSAQTINNGENGGEADTSKPTPRGTALRLKATGVLATALLLSGCGASRAPKSLTPDVPRDACGVTLRGPANLNSRDVIRDGLKELDPGYNMQGILYNGETGEPILQPDGSNQHGGDVFIADAVSTAACRAFSREDQVGLPIQIVPRPPGATFGE